MFHRLQTNVQKQKAQDDLLEKINNIKSVKLEKYHNDVSQGPHPKGYLSTENVFLVCIRASQGRGDYTLVMKASET